MTERTMNPVLSEMVRLGVARSEGGRVYKIHSQVPTEEGFFLKGLVSDLRPHTSLEVGLGYGISALFICDGLSQIPDARHIVIDPHQVRPGVTHMSFEGVGLENLRRAGYESLIEFHDAPSQLALPSLVSQGVKVDFAFIDGWHTFDFASVDFFYVDLLLRPGGVVVLDDTDFPSVWKLCRYISTNRSYSVLRCLPVPEPGLRLISGSFPRDLATRVSRLTSRYLHRLAHGDGLLPFSRCIAFKKEANDSRSWDFHRKF